MKVIIGAWSLTLGILTSCLAPTEQRGHPPALNTILGRGSLPPLRPTTKPSEPVEDAAVDLSALRLAWPEVESQLPRLITSVIAAGSWIDEHHVILADEGVLRLRHRPAVVAQVKRLMSELRAWLLEPLDLQLAFVELKTEALATVFSRATRQWDMKGLRVALGRGDGRSLVQVSLAASNGQWVAAERVYNQTYLSGVTVADGVVTPQTTTLPSGFSIQAAIWRWDGIRAVCAVTGSYLGEAVGGPRVQQTVHRALPSPKKSERHWEAHAVSLDLPVRELVEFQNQFSVSRGEWTVAALLPRDRGRVNVVLARVDWKGQQLSPTQVSPLSSKDYRLAIIPVALPTETGLIAGAKEAELSNRQEISVNAGSWFRQRAIQFQEGQKKKTYNYQNESGTFDFSLTQTQRSSAKSFYRKSSGYVASAKEVAPVGGGAIGLMPDQLERLRTEVMSADWPEGTALEFVANQIFVVHEKWMVDKVRSLITQIHSWRNRRVQVDVSFPIVGTDSIERGTGTYLTEDRAADLRRRAFLPPAYLLGRGGSWVQFFVGEMHSVLSGAWSPDRTSPPLHVYWRGARLAVQPQLSADETHPLEVRWSQHRLDCVAPAMVAGSVVQQPTDSRWSIEIPLRLNARTSALIGAQGEGPEITALLLGTSRHSP